MQAAVRTIGLDIAKSVFQVHGVDADGQVVIRRKLKRRYVLAFFEKPRPCLVGMEACGTSHHWSRELQALGHRVRLMPPAVSGAKASGELADGLMNGAAVPLDVVVGGYELLEWRIDVVEINVGDEAIAARINAGGFRTMQITARRDKIGKRPEIGEPARHCGVGIVAADSLVVIAFGVELLRLS